MVAPSAPTRKAERVYKQGAIEKPPADDDDGDVSGDDDDDNDGEIDFEARAHLGRVGARFPSSKRCTSSRRCARTKCGATNTQAATEHLVSFFLCIVRVVVSLFVHLSFFPTVASGQTKSTPKHEGGLRSVSTTSSS